LIALLTLLAKNIVRSRPGRAMQAVRDRDVAAAVIGVSLARYKIGAFVISSAYAAVAGALYGAYYNFVNPDHWNLFLSIQFIAVIIVGGVGTIYGAILGGIFVGSLPGIVIVVFLVLEPHGLAGIWTRIKTYFRTWPFSY
jgi:branched-chain amino acid transport system permease protein